MRIDIRKSPQQIIDLFFKPLSRMKRMNAVEVLEEVLTEKLTLEYQWVFAEFEDIITTYDPLEKLRSYLTQKVSKRIWKKRHYLMSKNKVERNLELISDELEQGLLEKVCRHYEKCEHH